MEKSATNTERAGNLIGKNLMDYRKGGWDIVNERLVSIFIHAEGGGGLRASFNSCNWNGGQPGRRTVSAIENRYFCLQGSGTTSPGKRGW